MRIHAMDADPIFTDEGDQDAAEDLVADAADAELFLYPGDKHLYVDSSLSDYDPGAASLTVARDP